MSTSLNAVYFPVFNYINIKLVSHSTVLVCAERIELVFGSIVINSYILLLMDFCLQRNAFVEYFDILLENSLYLYYDIKHDSSV